MRPSRRRFPQARASLTLGVVTADWLTDWESLASTPSAWIRPLPLTRA